MYIYTKYEIHKILHIQKNVYQLTLSIDFIIDN